MNDIAFAIVVASILMTMTADDWLKYKMGETKEEMKKKNGDAIGGFFIFVIILGLVIYLTP